MAYLLILSTAPSIKEARRLAKILLTQKLAACINITSPVESHYWWQGKQEKAKEVLLLIKTRQKMFNAVEKTIRTHHPYSVPEIISIPIHKGNQKYLAWIRGSVL